MLWPPTLEWIPLFLFTPGKAGETAQSLRPFKYQGGLSPQRGSAFQEDQEQYRRFKNKTKPTSGEHENVWECFHLYKALAALGEM